MELVSEKNFSSADVLKAIKDIESEMQETCDRISNTVDLLRRLRCKCFILDSSKNILEEKYKEITVKDCRRVKF